MLGYDSDAGSSNVGGFSTPIDPTPRPTNTSGQTSRGDNFEPNTSSYTASIESGSLRLVSTMQTSAGGDVVHGPYIISDNSIFIREGAKVTFDWQAKGGSDAFDIFAYLLDTTSGEAQIILNETGTSSGANTNLTSEEIIVDSSGRYKFVFVSGTFDYSFGQAAGASLFIDNISISNNTADPTVTEGAVNVTTQSNCMTAIEDVDAALQALNSQRASLGAISNRLDHIVANNTNAATNVSKSLGRIQDADFAAESTSLAKNQILQQASTAMLAQANASKQNILELLQS
jgi:flagellin-like hook-associated protein FlgL